MPEKTTNSNDRELLIKRVIKAKEKLPTSGLTTLFAFQYKAYNTAKKKQHVGMVLQYRIVDEDVTEKLEQLAELLKK